MIKIEINGKQVEGEKDQSIIELTDQLGIYIPRFCYHKELSNISACRACLVEIEGHKKLEPACSTKICTGMKINTNTEEALAARRAVLELLLINHPLDCPVCDKAGACDLQDIIMEHGKDATCYTEAKRTLASADFGPLVQTEMTRCIQCMKCTRFCSEIAGTNDLAAVNRGEHTTITIANSTGMTIGVAGNVIDLCPVGALLAKPELYTARNWELIKTPSIAAHDCVGSNMYIYSHNNKIAKIEAKENLAINGSWIADRERFSFQAIYSNDRLAQPLFKYRNKWVPTSWEDAIALVDKQFKKNAAKHGPDSIGGLISASATIEEQYLLQKYLRSFGSNNIDHRLSQLDFSYQECAPSYPSLPISVAEIAKQELVLLIGSDLPQEQPILALKLRQVQVNSGVVCAINPYAAKFNFTCNEQIIVNDYDLLTPLFALVTILSKKANFSLPSEIAESARNIVPTTADKKMAEKLLAAGGDKLILLGKFALSHPQASKIIFLCQLIAKLTKANFASLTLGANAAGAWLSGCVPHRLPAGNELKVAIGKNALQMLTQPLKAYLLLDIEPELDSIVGERANTTLQQAEFVVAMTSFTSESLFKTAHLLLPTATFAEKAGTFVNISGFWHNMLQLYCILDRNQFLLRS